MFFGTSKFFYAMPKRSYIFCKSSQRQNATAQKRMKYEPGFNPRHTTEWPLASILFMSIARHTGAFYRSLRHSQIASHFPSEFNFVERTFYTSNIIQVKKACSFYVCRTTSFCWVSWSQTYIYLFLIKTFDFYNMMKKCWWNFSNP
jgi:hypothetical protein